MILLVRLSEGSFLQSFIMILLGMALSTVGIDYLSGTVRFTFGITELGQGIDLLPVAMGIFGIAEVLFSVEERDPPAVVKKVKTQGTLAHARGVETVRRAYLPRVLPGISDRPDPRPLARSSPPSCPMSRRRSSPSTRRNSAKAPSKAWPGRRRPTTPRWAAPMCPLLALGIPFTPAMAMVLGALMLHNITPGPNLIQEKPDLFWGVIASMYIGNFMLLLLNLPMVNLFVSILRIPKPILLPVIVLLCLVGVYSVNASLLDLLCWRFSASSAMSSGRVGFQPAPLILAMVIGPMIENSLRQALNIAGGNLWTVLSRPICAGALHPHIVVFDRVRRSIKQLKEIPGIRRGCRSLTETATSLS